MKKILLLIIMATLLVGCNGIDRTDKTKFSISYVKSRSNGGYIYRLKGPGRSDDIMILSDSLYSVGTKFQLKRVK